MWKCTRSWNPRFSQTTAASPPHLPLCHTALRVKVICLPRPWIQPPPPLGSPDHIRRGNGHRARHGWRSRYGSATVHRIGIVGAHLHVRIATFVLCALHVGSPGRRRKRAKFKFKGTVFTQLSSRAGGRRRTARTECRPAMIISAATRRTVPPSRSTKTSIRISSPALSARQRQERPPPSSRLASSGR